MEILSTMLTAPPHLSMALWRPTLAVRDFFERVLGGECVERMEAVRMDSGKAQILSALVSNVDYTCTLHALIGVNVYECKRIYR